MFKRAWDTTNIPDRTFAHLKDTELDAIEAGYSRKAVVLNQRIADNPSAGDRGVWQVELAAVMGAIDEIRDERKYRNEVLNGRQEDAR